MVSLKSVDNTEETNFGHLRRHNAIEHGRANALDLLVKGKPLQDVLNALIYSLEASTDNLKCSILLLDESKQTLSAFAGPNIPKEYFAILQNLPVGPEEGCCGAAVYHGKPVFVENLSEHPNWVNYWQDAEKSGLRACWSHPIVSPDGEIFGTFSMYFPKHQEPEQDDIDSLRYEAKIVGIILERARNIQQLKEANSKLEQRVAERTQALTEANVLLKRALEQRNEVQTQLVEMENMAALGTMMSSLTHEINTPVGVAITAISHLRKVQDDSQKLFEQGNLKRSALEKFYQECSETAEIIERNLVRSTQLIKTFKQLSVDQHSQDARAINLCAYIDEILLSLKPRLKRMGHQFCVNVDPDLEVISNPGAISQLLINLIMNSAQHAFEPDEVGRIFISAKTQQDSSGQLQLELRYRDNGKGMNAHTVDNLYKPFFTMARNAGGSGLGMHICYNLVVKVLSGKIDCVSTPGKGVEFTVQVPVGVP